MLDRSLRRPGTLGAVLTAGAGAIHFAAAVPHFGETPLLGFGFAAIGWLQILGATLVFYRPGWVSGASVAALNIIAITAWGVSRTVGFPVGAGAPEQVAVPDAITVALEAGAATALLGACWRGRDPSFSTMPVAATLSAFVLAFAGSVGAMAQLGGGGHPHGSTPEASGTHDGGEGEVHTHPDGSLHVHLGAPAHRHQDGTVHIHATEEGRDPAGTPATPKSPHAPHEHPGDHAHPSG